jgi:hypothetical protein
VVKLSALRKARLVRIIAAVILGGSVIKMEVKVPHCTTEFIWTLAESTGLRDAIVEC